MKRGKTVNPSHLNVIRINLPVLTEFCGMQPYEGDYSYASLRAYLDEAGTLLSERSNQYTMKKEALVSQVVRQQGKEAFLQLKKAHYNIKLEEFVTGADNGRVLDVIDDVIVPRSGIIYLTPRSTMGAAPFYSSEKILGSCHIKTLWFNMGVILFMSLLAVVLLLTDCPGHYMRKDQ